MSTRGARTREFTPGPAPGTPAQSRPRATGALIEIKLQRLFGEFQRSRGLVALAGQITLSESVKLSYSEAYKIETKGWGSTMAESNSSVQRAKNDLFFKYHQAFVRHFGIAVCLSWIAALAAAWHAPWVRNIYLLIDPGTPQRAESTAAFLFDLPILMAIVWGAVVLSRELLRRQRILGDLVTEFVVAGVVGFVLFYLSIDRAVTALLLA
jgi:hypothetical protein